MKSSLIEKPKISVITVCFNVDNSIEKTMLSVLCQTYTDIEYIIVDGESTDNTMTIVNQVITRFPNAKTKVFSGKDNGIYDAMNKAIGLASGEWLNFMNSGDVFANNHILEDIVLSGLMNKASFIYSDFIADDRNEKRRIHQDYDEGKILHQSSIYKKELHAKFGLYYVSHPYIVSDYLFFLQVPKEQFAKYMQPISINDTSGISMQGTWMEYERISVDYMMKRLTDTQFVLKVIQRYLINVIKKILTVLKIRQ